MRIAFIADTRILNPGTPTEPRRAASRSMLALDVDGGSVMPKPIEMP